MSDQEGQFNFSPPNVFTDTSPQSQDLLNDISGIIGGKENKTGLSTHMQDTARQAGIAARGAKTVESEQEIYKTHLANATRVGSKSHAPPTRGDVVNWERHAKASRNGQ